jgi:hypothetical protein
MISRDVAPRPGLSWSPVEELARFVHEPLAANQFDLAHQPVHQITVTTNNGTQDLNDLVAG